MADEKKCNMEYRFLGNSGLKVSVLSFGNWINQGKEAQEEDTAYECCVKAYEAGCNFFDTAEAYASGGAERVLGKIIKRAGWKRSDLVISTKIFWGGPGPNDVGLSRKHIIEGVNASLERLQLDYVDLLFCHRPDPFTPIEETVRAMNFVINQGKAFYWGTSEWSAEQITSAIGIAERLGLIPPIMEQPQYSMLHRTRFEVEYAPLFQKYRMGTTVWGPLAFGLLTGKYNNGIPPNSRFSDETMKYDWKNKILGDEKAELVKTISEIGEIAKELGATQTQLALAWLIKNPNVSTVITGSSRPEQVEENFQALSVVPKLTPEIMERIEKALHNKPKPAASFRS